jgi:hypothetical protein
MISYLSNSSVESTETDTETACQQQQVAMTATPIQ